MGIKRFLIIPFILSLSFSAKAQQLNLFLNQDYGAFHDKALNQPGILLHTGFKPIIQSQVNEFMPCDSVMGYSFTGKKIKWLYRKLYQESLFIIKDSTHHFICTIDPLFNFELGEDVTDSSKKYYQNTRGILIQGSIGKSFSFSSTFYENQANYPYYIDQFVSAENVVPGQGRVKLLPAKGGIFYSQGYDFSSSSGYFTYSPCKHFIAQLGEGKNFIGDGYRSLLLSDNSFNYPYARFTTTFGHFQYTNVYAIFMNLFTNEKIASIGTEGLFQRKAASFQYLSWCITSRLEWGLFQGLIWQASDSNNRQHYDFNYFDPVIGVNALNYGLGNNKNVILGSTLKYKICPYLMAYGQFVADDLGNGIHNKTGFQAGLKGYINNAEIQIEYNQVNPYTYAATDSTQNYSHYNQALADPLGANFKEWIGIVNYKFFTHFTVHVQITYALIGLDSAGRNFGNNIFLSDNFATPSNGMHLTQGVTAKMGYFNGYLSYLLNPKTNMNIDIGWMHRQINYNGRALPPDCNLFYIGFRTSLGNIYNDF